MELENSARQTGRIKCSMLMKILNSTQKFVIVETGANLLTAFIEDSAVS